MASPKSALVDCPHCTETHRVKYRVQSSPYVRGASSPHRGRKPGESGGEAPSFRRYVTCPNTNQRFKVMIELPGRDTSEVKDIEIEGIDDDSP